MTATLLAIIAICSYLSSAVLIIRPLAQDKSRRFALTCAWGAIALHGAYTALLAQQSASFNFSFFSMTALVSMIVALLLLLATLSKPVENLGIFLFPLAALMLGLDLYFPEKQRSLDIHNWQMNTHILSAIIAFSLLNIAALQAILLAIQNQQLKSHPPKRYIQSMPSLQGMESLLFQMIGAGIFFLSITLVSGFASEQEMFAKQFAHKTFFSILAWFIFSGLLVGRRRYGWRGRTAIKWTLWGFMFLLLGYFGTKLVVELILHR